MECHDAGALVHAYLDDEIEQGDRDALRAHISRCGACTERLETLRALGRLVRVSPYYSAPAALRSRVLAQTHAAWRPQLLKIAAILAIGVMLAGAAVGVDQWRRSRAAAQSENRIVEEVVSAHVRALMGDHLVDVPSSDQHTVKPWFLGKIDFAPPVPDLSAQGFTLIGGRLDYVGGRAVAALIYRRRLHTIDVFIWPDSAPISVVLRSERGFQAVHGTSGGMTFWATSDLNAAELEQFARAFAGTAIQ